MMTSFFSICLLSCLFQVSLGLRNVTVDDTDSSIEWVGNWAPVPPGFISPLGGTYRTTSDAKAYAEFKFTGVAVYFVAPRFPAPASSKLVLDEQEATSLVVNLEDYETKTTDEEFGRAAILAGATGLANVEHTVRVMMGSEEGPGVFDGFIYTVLEEGDEYVPLSESGIGFAAVPPSAVLAENGPSSSSRVLPSAAPQNDGEESSSTSSRASSIVAMGSITLALCALLGL